MAALIHVAHPLALELGPSGIWVNALSPGSTLFESGGPNRTRTQQPEEFAAFEAMDFPRRRPDTVQKVADAAAFLASPRAAGGNAAEPAGRRRTAPPLHPLDV